MFKKLFRSLTQSKSEIYLTDLEEFAASLDAQRSAHAADTLRQFIAMKRDLDARIENGDPSLLPIDNLEPLCTALCEAVKARVAEAAATDRASAEVLTSKSSARFKSHCEQWRQEREGLLRAYAALSRVKGEGRGAIEEDPSRPASPLDDAIEKLLLEVRTAERIRDEL